MISIVIPVLNNWELTKQCLISLVENSRGHDVEVVVVDNASSDETATCLALFGEGLFGKRFVRLRQERNLNFGPASNLGARMGSGDLLLFLNNDTILTPGWLHPLKVTLESDHHLGAVGPLLMYPAEAGEPDLVQHLGISFEPQHYPRHLYECFPADHPLARRKRRLRALTGAALFMPRVVFEAAGGFHEAYVNGGEDIDLCLHIGKLARELACVPESRIYHLASKTPGRNDFEQHNAAVLKQRCVDMICPDLHLIAAAEGYEVRLTDWLRPYLALPGRRRDLLEKRSAALDVEGVEELLIREPLWHGGRRKTIEKLRSAGREAAAMRHAFLLTKHCQSSEAFQLLLELATRQADERMQRYARANIQWFTTNVRESGPAAAKFMAGYMAKLGEVRLAAQYRNWLLASSGATVPNDNPA
jgi:hypothetical protein